MFRHVFFRVPKSPKLSIFLGLGLSSTFASPPSYINRSPPPWGSEQEMALYAFLSVKDVFGF